MIIDKIDIYTDGACSKNPGPGGWAGIVISYSKNDGLGNNIFSKFEITGNSIKTTNNRMELTAIVESLIFVLQNFSTNSIEIFSDSAYVVNAVNKGWVTNWRLNNWQKSSPGPIKNIDLWEQLYKLIVECHNLEIILTFTKVKGHQGNKYNELADILAKSEVLKVKGE